jgi:triosephosphate isomerase (TIM)
MERKKLLGGNWKLSCSMKDFSLAEHLNREDFEGHDAFIAVPYPYLKMAKDTFPEYIKVGSQDCSRFRSGAYTGEVSAYMLKELGAEYVIIGHSERRKWFGECSDVLLDKLANALDAGLRVVLCVGEKGEDRESGKFLDAIMEQITSLGSELKNSEAIDIAYEPVWAIGTGSVATVEEISEVFKHLRERLTDMGFSGRLVYGGSVSESNCAELCRVSGLGGFLVGNASLNLGFNEIARELRRL